MIFYHIYGFWQISRTIDYINLNPKIVVEIGGGYGNLANKFISLYKNIKYIIIDLPEILMVQHYYLEKCCLATNTNKKIINIAELDIAELDNQGTIDINSTEFDILLVPCNQYNKLNNIRIDLLINMRSFGEMPKNVLDNYFKWIEQNINQSGLMYLVNRYVFTKSKDKVKLRDFPINDKWNILLSQPQWLQTHLHEFILQQCNNPYIKPSFVLKSFPYRTPPPGPIMKIQTQEDWLNNQNLSLYTF